MGLEKDILRIKKKLESMVSSQTTDHATALDLLQSLKRLPITLEVLQKTKIGISVNNFRKSANSDEVVNLAKSLIKGWKKLLTDGANSQQSSSKSPGSSSVSRSNSTGGEEDSRDSTTGSAPGSDNESNNRSAEQGQGEPGPDAPAPIIRRSSVPDDIDDTDDPVRLKCRELLTNALKMPPQIEGCASPEAMAAAIEHFIFKEFRSTEVKYKNRVRSRVANLKDSKNPKLRENVLYGFIPPEKIACMTAEEMASDELKNLRSKFTKEAIDDHQLATQSGTKTDLFKCGRCGHRECSYNQVQTRSADEPMTTFVVCHNCGNRWKFC